MTRFLYFAYGSNMLTERLSARCPSAVAEGAALAPSWSVAYCHMSDDGSAKAGLVADGSAEAAGVLFSLDEAEIAALDAFEGTRSGAYHRVDIEVARRGGDRMVRAATYVPQVAHHPPALMPYAWYRALCAGGAHVHGLPDPAIAVLRHGPVQPMPDRTSGWRAWSNREAAHLALTAARLPIPDDDRPLT